MKFILMIGFLLLSVTGLANSAESTTGEVCLVLGSDTAIWDGMDVAVFHCTYNPELYTDPTQNTYQVMSSAFRQRFVDSYGQTLKMTWWMMAGNIYRYATNKDVPLANCMTLYLMKHYHGDAIRQWGDELSLHYHTFVWSDYDGDGKYWWNQALSFNESRDDFDLTLCQYLLEENTFPVSFRSGWHYMDDEWQSRLNEILPYSLHNDWPNNRVDTTEPLDNTYHWNLSPREFVPYQPAEANYQLPGGKRGWNVRSTHMSTCRAQDLMDTLFYHANQGSNQIACLWAHLPEADFLDNITAIDELAHLAAAKYPEVKFRYCTAVEAMQRWRRTLDQQPPDLILQEVTTGDQLLFKIQTNEPIFQLQPFVAVKDVYENYAIVPCQATAQNEWQTTEPLLKNQLAKVGVVVCDTVGNQSMQFLNYLPDDIYIDNGETGYQEIAGNWFTTAKSAWGLDARYATLTQTDTAQVSWSREISVGGYYNIFVQLPALDNIATNVTFQIYSHGVCQQVIPFTNFRHQGDWIYIGTALWDPGDANALVMEATGKNQPNKILPADVVKFSALVRDYDLYIEEPVHNIGSVSQGDPVRFDLKLENRGRQELTVTSLTSTLGLVTANLRLPFKISSMSSMTVPLQFLASDLGAVSDTLRVTSNDPLEPVYDVVITANVESYFVIVDNDDSLQYFEERNWHYSNAQAYGASSRYASLSEPPGANARFITNLRYSGIYEIFEIVPTTVNASEYAVYLLRVADAVVDSVVINQNLGSGGWVSLGRYYLPADQLVEIEVLDTGLGTKDHVLRADAIKFALVEEGSGIVNNTADALPNRYHLSQNYPNPFNPTTVIEFDLPRSEQVTLLIYDINGKLVRQLLTGNFAMGKQQLQWDGLDQFGLPVASGIYLYTLRAGDFTATKKMLKLQ